MIKKRKITSLSIVLAFLLMAPVLSAVDIDNDLARELGLQLFEPGTVAPDFELEYLSGERRKLSSFRGKVVFLNFWATWCPPCRAEMPSMQKLYERFEESGLSILAVDLQEAKSAVQKFVDSYGLTFDIPLDSDGRVGAMYGVRSIPTTYIVYRDGTIAAVAIGGRDWNTKAAFRFIEAVLDNKLQGSPN